MFRCFTPDLTNWHTEGRGVYVHNNGMAKVEKRGNRWVPFIRSSVDACWQESRYVYGALHAAQDDCRRELQKAALIQGRNGAWKPGDEILA